jgi:predicted aspartyl protease
MKPCFGIAALFVLMIPVAILAGFAPKEERQPDIESAHALFKVGKFVEAEKLYAPVAARDPKRYAAVVRLGSIALFSNRLDEAQKWLEKANALKPDEDEAKILLAEAFYRRDDFQKAVPLLRAAGRQAKAKKLASFQDLTPYRIEGLRLCTSLKFVKTDPLPLVRVRVNGGKEVNFLIDSGGGEVTVDRALAQEIGLKPLETERATFAGGKTADIHHGRIDSLTLGDWVVHNVPVMLMNTRRLSGPIFGGKERVDGVLGTVLLYHFLSTLDHPNGELILRRKAPGNLGQSGAVLSGSPTLIPFWMAGDHTIVAWGRVEKREPALFFIDTGLAGGGVSLTELVIKEAGIRLREEQATEMIGGGGRVRSIPFTLNELALGEVKRQNVKGWFDGRSPFEHTHGFWIAGIISHDFFRPYSLSFDFERMRLILLRRKD